MLRPKCLDTLLVVLLAALVVTRGAMGVSARQTTTPATPHDAVPAILEAFRTHQVVGLGEAHGSERIAAFRIALLRDERFPTVVNDLLVEFGSSRYQEVIDRFVRGEAVSDRDLRHAWEDTTVPNPVWDRPVYENFFRTVREVNAGLSRDRQLRVLLADPPIDWDEVKTRDEYRAWSLRRGTYAAEVVQREVIDKDRRVLAIFGDGHFQARTERPARGWAGRLTERGVEMIGIASASSRIAQLQPDTAAWPTPSLAFVRGTPIGAAGYDFFYGPTPPGEYWTTHSRFEDHYDAVLYLGPEEGDRESTLTYPRCADPDYVAMRLKRMEVAGTRTPPGAPTSADRLKQDCVAR